MAAPVSRPAAGQVWREPCGRTRRVLRVDEGRVLWCRRIGATKRTTLVANWMAYSVAWRLWSGTVVR